MLREIVHENGELQVKVRGQDEKILLLEKALKPFADAWQNHLRADPDKILFGWPIGAEPVDVSDFRRAHETLYEV